MLQCGEGDGSFAWRLRALTRGVGVHVVLGGMQGGLQGGVRAGPRLYDSLQCVRPWGRVLHCGRGEMLSRTTVGESG